MSISSDFLSVPDTEALNLQEIELERKRRWKLQEKENSRKDLTIRICVNLQGMELSRKSRSGSCNKQNLQGNEFGRS